MQIGNFWVDTELQAPAHTSTIARWRAQGSLKAHQDWTGPTHGGHQDCELRVHWRCPLGPYAPPGKTGVPRSHPRDVWLVAKWWVARFKKRTENTSIVMRRCDQIIKKTKVERIYSCTGWSKETVNCNFSLMEIKSTKNGIAQRFFQGNLGMFWYFDVPKMLCWVLLENKIVQRCQTNFSEHHDGGDYDVCM